MFMKKQKKPNTVFYLILVLIPILFFVILELSLRLFNYGVDTSTWIKITDTHYGLNPNVARRYFHSVNNVPESIQDVFAIAKEPNTFRVFVLGGSSAAGYPFMPLGSFSRYIRQRLEQNYPEINIEVVNLSLTAVNSYTIRDLIPDVLDEDPDLILIYAGHNEYYGALGVGSMESLGKSTNVVNFLLSINNFKIVQLVGDVLKAAISLLPDDNESKSGTLMARMAQNQKIELESETYELGIQQFRKNITDAINLVQKQKVPIIISTLVSNIKDQHPFISNLKNSLQNAKKVYAEAKKQYSVSNYTKADSLFRLAKDLDQLRFRAPERLNEVIRKLGAEFNIPIVNTDSILSFQSPNGIIGDNLMIDHLHLTLEGYKDLGQLFYEEINSTNLLPNKIPIHKYEKQDSITRKYFIFSELDSSIANFKLQLLKNDWPFTIFTKKKKVSSLVKLENYIDSLAYNFVIGEEEWEKAHRILAATFMQRNKFDKGKKEIDLLIHQYPLIVEYNKFISNELIKKQRFNEALEYLERGYKLNPSHFFCKWLGIINLSHSKIDTSIHFLEESLNYISNDAQVLYNLSGAYSKKNEFEKALDRIQKCLSINPNYKGAILLKNQLQSIVRNN